jgi:hypothetical protein
MPLQYRRTIGRRKAIDCIPEFWRLWHDKSVDMLAIAAHFNVAIGTVRRTARRLGLPPRNSPPVDEVPEGREAGDPTEEEIWGRGGITERIRAGWSARREYEARVNATSMPGEEVGTARSRPHLRR